MLTKNDIKDIQSLYHKKNRDEEGLFIAEGPKLALEIINSNCAVKNVYATAKWLQENDVKNTPVVEITDTELSRISSLQTPNSVLVVAYKSVIPEEPVFSNQLTLMLDGIQDPGNMGTIIRIADWFGLSQIICSNDCADMYNPKVVQSSMGSIVRIKCWYKDFDEWALPANIPIYGAILNGQNVFAMDKIKECILVIGNESKGIRKNLLSKISHPVTIPRWGGAESLNAAVATGIIVGQMVGNTK